MKIYGKILSVSVAITLTGLLISAGAGRADSWQPLRDDPEITSGLTVIAVGRHIHNVCEGISARPVRSIAFAEGLVARAEELGYTRREINDYVDNRDEQERYRAIARRYFAQQGGNMDDVESVCQVGRDEITAGSTIGRLLRGG